MNNILREFGVKLGLDFDPSKAEKAKKQIEELGTHMKSLGFEVAAATGSILALMGITGEHAHALENQSKEIGITTDKLQEMQFAAKKVAGVTNEELTGALQGLTGQLFEARTNNAEAIKSFGMLGFTMEEISDPALKADGLLEKVSDRLSQFKDPMQRAQLATKLLGDQGRRLLPLLEKGSGAMKEQYQRAHQLGVVLDEAAIKQGAHFREQFEEIWMVIKNISYTVGNIMIKHLHGIVMQFQNWIVQNKKLIAQGLGAFFKTLSTVLGVIFRVIDKGIIVVKHLTEKLGGLNQVLKYIAIGFGIFKSAQLAGSLIGIAKAFNNIGTAMKFLNVQSMLIGAAFLAIILVVQDLFSEDSIIKQWFATFKKQFPEMAGFAEDFVNVMVDGAKMIYEGWAMIWDIFKGIGAWLSDIGGGILPTVLGKLEGMFKYLRSGALGEKIFDILNPSAAVPSGANVAAAAAGVAGGTAASAAPLTATQNFYFGKDTQNAKAVGEAAYTGTKSAHQEQIRQTRNQSSGGVKY